MSLEYLKSKQYRIDNNIEFKKKTDTNIEIFVNYSKVGHLENHIFSKHYILEIDYFRVKIPYNKKDFVSMTIMSMIKSRVKVAEYMDKHNNFFLANLEYLKNLPFDSFSRSIASNLEVLKTEEC